MSRSERLRIDVQLAGEAVVVSPNGPLEAATAPQLQVFLAKRLADQPTAVIVVLQDLTLRKDFTLSLFTAVVRQAAEWSGVPLLLVNGKSRDRELRRHSELIARFIPVFADLGSALASLSNLPTRQLTRLRLIPKAGSATVARRYVAATCELWHCEDVSEDAVAIASELFANVVRHAPTDAVLRMELRRQRLTVSVSDESPGMPVRPRQDSPLTTGRGLRIVAGLADTWGAVPNSTGGKLVWACLRMPGSDGRAAINNGWRNGL